MGVWGNNPWDSDDAADWLADTLKDLHLDERLDEVFAEPQDNYEAVRAAAYLLQVLGFAYVWPGDLDRLDAHLTKAITLLESMIDPESTDEDMDFLELWDNDPEIIAAVQAQIIVLKSHGRPGDHSS
jgi:hypothetical protein